MAAVDAASATSKSETPSRASLVVTSLGRVARMYTVLNLALLVVAIGVRAIRGFVLCNTALVLAVSFVTHIVDCEGLHGMVRSFGLGTAAADDDGVGSGAPQRGDRPRTGVGAVAMVDFATHVLPLVAIAGWASDVTALSAVLPILCAFVYVACVDMVTVYGVDMYRRSSDVLVHMLACYVATVALLWLGAASKSVAAGVAFALACAGVACAVVMVLVLARRHEAGRTATESVAA